MELKSDTVDEIVLYITKYLNLLFLTSLFDDLICTGKSRDKTFVRASISLKSGAQTREVNYMQKG